MEKGINGRQRAQEYLARFEAWLSEQTSLPGRGGKPNLTEIARQAGIGDRQRFAKTSDGEDSEYAKLLNKALKNLPLVASEKSDNETARMERRIRDLETRADKEMGENFELKRKLKKLEHIERIIESGWRFIP